jgi:hypothetical protein
VNGRRYEGNAQWLKPITYDLSDGNVPFRAVEEMFSTAFLLVIMQHGGL